MAKKDKKSKKDKKGEAGDAAVVVDTSDGLRLTDHPRAARTIRAAKGWGGLAGFGLGLLLGTRAGLPTSDALLRAIEIGVVAYLLTWAVAVVVWKQIARAELEELRRILVAAAEQAEAEVARRRAEREAQEARTT